MFTFTTRVPIVIDPSYTLVYKLNEAHTRHDQTYSISATRVSVFLGSSIDKGKERDWKRALIT